MSHPSANNPGAANWKQIEAWPIRRWVSPFTGRVSIDGFYSHLPGSGSGGNGANVTIFHNGRQIFEAHSSPAQTAPTAYRVGWNTPLRVQAGDTLDFALNPIADDMNSDATRFTAIVRPGPPLPTIVFVR